MHAALVAWMYRDTPKKEAKISPKTEVPGAGPAVQARKRNREAAESIEAIKACPLARGQLQSAGGCSANRMCGKKDVTCCQGEKGFSPT
ncbi:hypothetical protein NDU88_012972 [Pleurodeles waltl]|uniref:Uncharacterized protein n=1 Tax=Pleurodeles waltl TaxID=8319 RepID=A0AAV7R3D5_PLEWA|nr:hypothetical protein NDU88_012972 [Pleurodeles waltl]